MTAIVLAGLLLLALVAGIVGVVVVGLEGRGGDRVPPDLGLKLTRAARHLNGDGTPPAAFLRVLRALRLHVG